VFRQLHMVASADLRLYALLLFFLVFMAVLVRLFVIARREDFLFLSQLPLRADDSHKDDNTVSIQERKDEAR
jgi:hypothetical protein